MVLRLRVGTLKTGLINRFNKKSSFKEFDKNLIPDLILKNFLNSLKKIKFLSSFFFRAHRCVPLPQLKIITLSF